MKKTVLFIYNPVAGKGIVSKNLNGIKKLFALKSIKVLCFGTEKRGDAYSAASKFSMKYGGKKGYYLVAAGGDGTLNEVVRGVIDSGSDIPIGVIPTGSTNDFGYSLGITGSVTDKVSKVIEAIDSGRSFDCDTACLNGRFFVYTATFGLFSDVSYMTPQRFKNVLGRAAYVLYGIVRLGLTRKIHTRIEYDGKYVEKDLMLGMVVSAKSVGGFRKVTGRDVSLNDGRDEIFLVIWPKNVKELCGTVLQVISIMAGNGSMDKKVRDPDKKYGISIIKARRIKFSFTDKVPFSMDGEFGGEHKEAYIEVFRKRLHFVV